MIGARAYELVKDLQHDLETQPLPPFREAEVKEVIQEIKELNEEIEERINTENGDPPLSHKVNALVHLTSLLRDKRCLLSYLNERFERVKQIRWHGGLPLPELVASCMSHEEEKTITDYDSILVDYIAQLDFDLSIRMEPPSDPFVHVLVEEDSGEIVTLDGSVRLSKGTKHYIRKSDVEILIRQQKLSVLPE